MCEGRRAAGRVARSLHKETRVRGSVPSKTKTAGAPSTPGPGRRGKPQVERGSCFAFPEGRTPGRASCSELRSQHAAPWLGHFQVCPSRDTHFPLSDLLTGVLLSLLHPRHPGRTQLTPLLGTTPSHLAPCPTAPREVGVAASQTETLQGSHLMIREMPGPPGHRASGSQLRHKHWLTPTPGRSGWKE